MKKRQKIRKALTLISFLLFPVTMFYLSPALILMGASQGIISGSFLAFGILFISSLLLGRVFCGWVCPGAGLHEACFPIQDKKVRKGNWIKYLIWVPWMLAILLLFLKSGGIREIDPLFQLPQVISINELRAYVVYYFFIFLIVVLALAVGRRSFCHQVCWMAPFMIIGRKIRNLFQYPSLRLEAYSLKCKHCQTCTKNCPMSLEVEGMVKVGEMENAECILCGTCVDGCPESVLRFSFKK